MSPQPTHSILELFEIVFILYGFTALIGFIIASILALIGEGSSRLKRRNNPTQP